MKRLVIRCTPEKGIVYSATPPPSVKSKCEELGMDFKQHIRDTQWRLMQGKLLLNLQQ